MNTADRNRRIWEIRRSHPAWTYKDIAELVGLTRQRVQQIVRHVDRYGTIDSIMEPIECHLNGDPISATQAEMLTGISRKVIFKWVERGLVKVVSHPGHGGRGNPVLLDPVSLKERLALYRPKRRRARVAA